MSKVATIDFELRSQSNVKVVGSWKYSIDPTTSPICLAYAFDDDPVQLWTPALGDPEDLFDHIKAGGMVEAFNAGFERNIWSNIMVPRFGWVPIPFESWRCSSAMSAAFALPHSLGEAGKAIGAPIKKDPEGHSTMLRVSRPRKPSKHNPDVWNFKRKDLVETYEYCKTDVEAERSLGRVVPALSPFELEVWRLDQRINERGIYIDRESIELILERVEELERESLLRFAEITDGLVETPGQVVKIKEFAHLKGVFIPDTQKETILEWFEKDLVEDRDVAELLRLRLFFGKAAVKKYQTMINNLDPRDNRIRDTLIYHGAHTGRWTGRRVQTQNLFRSETKDDALIEYSFEVIRRRDWSTLSLIYGNEMSAFASLTRSVFIATPGFELFVADYSSVETCFLFWLTDDLEPLAEIKAGRDIYRVQAAQVFGIDYDEVNENQRQFGKKLILGLGYGMGDDTFLDECIDAGINLDPEFIRWSHLKYREIHSAVVQFWKHVERTFKQTLEDGQSRELKRLVFSRRGRRMRITLPSGRRLNYHETKIRLTKKRFKIKEKIYNEDTEQVETVVVGEEWREVEQIEHSGVDTKTGKWIRQTTYGAKLVENIVQGGCRDLMSYAMPLIWSEGYRILWTSHDEVISEREIGKGNLDRYCDIMSQIPKWAEGCPIRSDGYTARRYKKG